MTDKAEAAERKAFEAAMIERGHPIRLHTDGTYLGMNSYRWEGWQAGAAVKAQAAPTEAQGESPFKFRPWSKEAEMIEGWTAAEKAREAAQGEDSARLEAIRYVYPTRVDLDADVSQETAAIATAVSAMADALDECPLTDSLKIYAAIELAFKYCDPKHVEEVFDEIVFVRNMR